jgi:hypothetical protein
MNAVIPPVEIEPEPIAIDPRPCGLCGLTIDRHEMVDGGEGPEFFCFRDGDIVTDWELADPRDRWRHTGEPPPTAAVRNSDILARPADRPRPYRTPQATIDAFFYVLKTKDAAGIASWLAAHPQDERQLYKIWKQKCSTAAAK